MYKCRPFPSTTNIGQIPSNLVLTNQMVEKSCKSCVHKPTQLTPFPPQNLFFSESENSHVRGVFTHLTN